MAIAFEQTQEFIMGDVAQKRWAEFVASRGGIVLPTYGMKDVSALTKAPVLLHADGILVVPDLLVLSTIRPHLWHEVKAKTIPSWRRLSPGPRWEHGIDYALLREYEDVQAMSGMSVLVVVHEKNSPLHDEIESAATGPEKWLYITLADCFACGDRRTNWPRKMGEGSRRRQGGWLWPREQMKEIEYAAAKTPKFA